MPNNMQGTKIIIPKKETAADTWESLNRKYEYQLRKKEIPALAANYFGTGADGAVVYSADTSLATTLDGDILVKNYTDLTVDITKTLDFTNRCRGAVLFVDGDATINGTILAPGGCKANPADSGITGDTPVAPGDGNAVGANGIRFPFITAAGSDTLSAAEFEGTGTALHALISEFPELNSNGDIIAFPRVGGAGGAGITTSDDPGTNGTAGSTNQTGGGGSGAGGISTTFDSDDGGDGTCFSGGVGSGGRNVSGTDVSDYGGAGQDGKTTASDSAGTGNPSGAGRGTEENGTGGLLIIICSGTITVGASGIISANGVESQACQAGGYGCGGASGGGAILLAHVGSYTNNGTVEAAGGAGGNAPVSTWDGGDGGAGTVQTLAILG